MGGWVNRAITAPARCAKAGSRAFQGKTEISPAPAPQPTRSIPMKTKPFLLATAGSTVDGRVIDDKMIDEMASSYDPKTYGARINIEHIRGISGGLPFRAYGDIVALSVGDVDVNFNGTTEKRKALYGVFDITADAKSLNEANQKVYPSIEIEPNFGGKGFAYCMGVALTDSPAAIATEKLQFNRARPGTINLTVDTAHALVADDADGVTTGGNALLSSMSAMLDKFTAAFAPKAETKPEPKVEENPAAPTAFDFSALRPLLAEFGNTVSASIDGLRTDIDALSEKVKKQEETLESAPAHTYRARPLAGGSRSSDVRTDC
jgi:hypothetical protein